MLSHRAWRSFSVTLSFVCATREWATNGMAPRIPSAYSVILLMCSATVNATIYAFACAFFIRKYDCPSYPARRLGWTAIHEKVELCTGDAASTVFARFAAGFYSIQSKFP